MTQWTTPTVYWADGASHTAAGDALFYTAVVLLSASVFRGACTMVQNYQGEAVGHAVAYELQAGRSTRSSSTNLSATTTTSTPAI